MTSNPIRSAIRSIIHTPWRKEALIVGLCAMLLCSAGLVGTLWLERRAQADLPHDLPPLNPLMTVPQLGVNVDLAQYSESELHQTLAQIQRAGFFWVRQAFPWADIERQQGQYHWETWDRIVEAVHQHDLLLIAALDTSPLWAKGDDGGDEHTPPREAGDFGRFARAFAARYGDRIDYYQIWDEPNLSYRWGGKAVDAQAYTQLLREGAIQIRQTDPGARILTAGLAPTVETGPINLNAAEYLARVYAAGGASYFDIVAAKCYGFEHEAWDRQVEVGRLNFPRARLLRQVMEREGDAWKPVWAVEFGWNSLPSDWDGPASPWETVGAEQQITYTLDALRRAEEEWPWMGAMLLSTWQPDAPSQDPVWGFALVDREGHPRSLLQRLLAGPVLNQSTAHPGRYPPQHPSGQYDGRWQVTPEGADIGASGDRLTIHFRGTRLDLALRKGNYWAVLYVTIDGKPTSALPQSDDGRSYVVLYDPVPRTEHITLARHLPYGDHTAEIQAQGGWDQWAIVGWSVHREADTRTYDALQIGCSLGLLMAASVVMGTAWALPWPGQMMRALKICDAVPPAVSQSITLISASVFYFAPGTLLSLPGLTMLALSLFLSPGSGLPAVALALPFYRQPKVIMGKAFSMAEMVTMATLAAWSVRQLLGWLTRRQKAEYTIGNARAPSSPARWMKPWRLMPLDWSMAALGFVALASLAVAQERHVAFREFRTVVFEPLVFYALIRATLKDRGQMWRVVDAWMLSGLLVAIWGLFQFASGRGIITTDGTWRVRGPYGSPNNLALMLGRQLPLLTAVVVFSQGRWRRWGYALVLAPALAAFSLSYSRAGLLLGLPVPLLFLGLARGGRSLLGILSALVLGGLGITSVLGTQRFRTLLDLRHGTLFFRLKLWQSSLAMIRDHPLLGVGLDNFLYQYRSRYILPTAWQEPNLSHPHNLLLEFWTRLGLLGVAALAWLETQFFQQAWKLYRRLPEGDPRALVLGTIGAMVNVLAHGLVDNGFFVPDLAYAFCLLVGLVAQLAARGELTAGQDVLE